MATSTNKTATFGVKLIHKFNGDWSRAIITNFFIPELNNHDVQELWFQQDGATCHTARATIDLLKDTLGDRLISRFGPVNWPPRSCDLTPLDYFLWGYVKSLVYADKPQTLDHLEDNIRRVIANIRPQMLENVIENWTSRLDYIRASSGSHMPQIIFKMTVDVQGESSIPINTTGNERTSFTVVLCCAANGLKLPPMLIFKRKMLPKENFPKGVEIRANENGWMNEQIMLSWLQTIRRKCKNSFFRPKAFLIMDSMKSHVSENVKNALKSTSAKIAIIPAGLTKKLQPLDIGINRSFKSKVRKLWDQWMSDG
ncbi:pogo transposable element with KRAB domain [Trichonephila clavipes]|nr:pogo transposable element with KRAB domain [Trichonephila clavipes]